jgi:large subunit ribosomal protein L7Ae
MVEIDEKQAFMIIQKARDTGSVKIGVNEVTKALERGVAKAVFAANDVSPAEIVAHLGGLSREMKVVYGSIGTKAELGASVGVKATTAIAIIDAGAAKKDIENLAIVEEKVVEEKVVDEKAVEEKVEEKTETKTEKASEEKEVVAE